MAPKVNPMQHHCTTDPGTKEALSEEVAPWNPSTARDRPLSEDNGTLHPQGSLYVVNKIHALHVEDVKDCKNTCIVVTVVQMSKMSKIVKILVFNPG